MKLSQWLSRAVLVAVPAATAPAASSGRTNINPALVYYEAFLLFPAFSLDERNYLFLQNWEGRTLEPRLGELLSRYNGALGLLRQAAGLSVPCDWGFNLAEGPFQELPRLAKAKHLAQMALLDVSWQLQNGHPAEARADLLGVVALARNLSQDDLFVCALVRIAIEALATHSIAAHFYQLDIETIEALSQALEQDHGSLVARCIPTENLLYRRWYVDTLKRLQQENPGNDQEVLRRARQLLVPPGESETQNTAGLDLWEEWVRASAVTMAAAASSPGSAPSSSTAGATKCGSGTPWPGSLPGAPPRRTPRTPRLHCSPGTVKSRLFHALAKLRLMKDLGKECIEP